MSALTPWFPADVKPVRAGVYKTTRAKDHISDWYQRWNGTVWCRSRLNLNEAGQETVGSIFQNVRWRGLAADPSVKP